LRYNRVLGTPDSHGYLNIVFRLDGKNLRYRVHEVIAFVGGLNLTHPLTINHKDGNKLNNKITNLETVTIKQNIIHAHKLGLSKAPLVCGELSINAKLTLKQVKEIKITYQKGSISTRKLASEYGVSHTTIRRIINGKIWSRGNYRQGICFAV